MSAGRPAGGRGGRGSGGRPPARRATLVAGALGGLLLVGLRPAAGAAQQAEAGCRLCHGELELLRQQTPDMERAREIHVAVPAFRASAHGEMSCAACHEGFSEYPHPDRGPATASCGSCHGGADSAWARGAHAPGTEDRPREEGASRGPGSGAACVDCHGTHRVSAAEALREGAGMRLVTERCVGCHAAARLPATDPHADSVACHACHRPHDVGYVGTPGAATAPARQVETCGACHEEVVSSWRGDVHGTAVLEGEGRERAGAGGASVEEGAGEASVPEGPPACSTCHGAHGVTVLAEGAPPGAEVARCDDCHEEYADTFGDSYHGQAVSLGSPAAASCADCHTGHAILPASDPASTVAPGNLVETCGACHPEANASFVAFQPHADPHDPEKNAVLYWSYKFMTWLLVGVMGVFGLHTLLWLMRLGIERVRSRGGEAGR